MQLHCKKMPCRTAPNSDVDKGGAEPNDVGVGIFQSQRRWVRATVVHSGMSRSFFYSVAIPSCWYFSRNRGPEFKSCARHKVTEIIDSEFKILYEEKKLSTNFLVKSNLTDKLCSWLHCTDIVGMNSIINLPTGRKKPEPLREKKISFSRVKTLIKT